ncbi:MAG: hypothetical protein LOD89_07350 [Tissierellales bacterium]
MKQYSKKANINKKITPMTLRHSFAFHRLNSIEDINKSSKTFVYRNL